MKVDVGMKEFQEYCHEKGHHFVEVEEGGFLHALQVTWLERAKKHFRGGHVKVERPFWVGFVLNDQFNAWASTYHGCDLIGINSGALMGLQGLARAVLSHPYIFPDVGDPTLSTPHVFAEDVAFPPRRSSEWKVAPLACAEREKLSQIVYQGILTHLFEHELAHILHGHLGFARSGHPISAYEELSGRALRGLTYQTLEVDADRAGSFYLLQSGLYPEQIQDGFKWKLTDRSILADNEKTVQLASLSATLFGSMLSTNETIEIPACLEKAHPPFSFRAYILSLQ